MLSAIMIKCAILVNLSTMTHIESIPRAVLGNFMMKSIVILSHFHIAMGNSYTLLLGI